MGKNYFLKLHIDNELSIDTKNRFVYNNKRKACFSSGLTLKSDMLVNHAIDRWRTTLKSDIYTSL